MKRLSIMTTRTVPISDAEARATTTSKAMKVVSTTVRFSQPEATLVVPPTEPLSALEKRSMWYTFKELQRMHQCDVDRVTHFQEQQAVKGMRHKRRSSPIDDDSFSWRGMEEAVMSEKKSSKINRKNIQRPTRNDRVKETIRQVVAVHHECVAKELPCFNDELCQASEKCTLADRQRAYDWAIQDAKDVGIQGVVVGGRPSDFSSPSKVMGKLNSVIPSKHHIRKLSNALTNISVELLGKGTSM
jgi:hypothetical protein